MRKEIERKFLVQTDAWRSLAGNSEAIRQGYLVIDKDKIVRIRHTKDKAMITIKHRRDDLEREEFEYEIPAGDAQFMLKFICIQPIIEKIRHRARVNDTIIEIDEFQGENKGLIVAEVELDARDDNFPRPDWLGLEVSHDNKYLNAELVKHPYSAWKK